MLKKTFTITSESREGFLITLNSRSRIEGNQFIIKLENRYRISKY